MRYVVVCQEMVRGVADMVMIELQFPLSSSKCLFWSVRIRMKAKKSNPFTKYATQAADMVHMLARKF